MVLVKFIVKFVFLLFFPMSLYGYFHDLQEWSNGRQTLFLFSDIHKDIKKDYAQRIDLIKAAKRLNAFVIVEDMLNPEFVIDLDVNVWKSQVIEFKQAVETSVLRFFMSAILQDFYEKNSDGAYVLSSNFDSNKDYSNLLPRNYLEFANPYISPLLCLTQFCYQQGIPVKNVEFRFKEVLNDILKQHEKIVAEIKMYRDCPILEDFYSKVLYSVFNSQVNALLDALNSKNRYISYADFLKDDPLLFGDVFCKEIYRLSQFAYQIEGKIDPCDLSTFKNRKEYLIGVYDQYFIDARILHEIYDNPRYSNIFVCAGGDHIDGIIKILPKLGFVPKVKDIGTTGNVEAHLSVPCVIGIKEYFFAFHNILI